MRGSGTGIGRGAAALLAAASLAVFAAQAVVGMRLLNATGDETVHLPAGYTYLKTGDLRLNPEHPPLMKELCALPLLALAPTLDLDDPGWSAVPPDQSGFGYRFLYGNDADRLLFWGRLPVVLLGLLLGVYVYRWAAELHGREAGLLALGLYAFSPNLIAHTRLVTMDLGLACFFVACLYHLWRWQRQARAVDLAAAGLALGLALAAKFSGAILALAVLLLTGAELLARRGDAPRARLRHAAVTAVATLAVAGVVVWAAYLFPLDPGFYLDGMRKVNENHRPDYAEYLAGRFAVDGFWYYFPVAMLVKTPLPTLVLCGLSLALWRRRNVEDWRDEAYLAGPGLLFLVVTTALADNIGVRYVLPLFPLMFIWVSRLAGWVRAKRTRLAVGVLLCLWYVAGAARIWPDHLAYFNEAAGGPVRGHRWLDDSNIDWGLDLKRLEAELERRGIERVRLIAGPWSGNPDYYGISWEPVRREEWRDRPLRGEWYVVSTHMLIRGELVARRQGTRNNWLSLYEPAGRVGYSFYLFRFD